MSALIGADIRVGRHPCFERLAVGLDAEYPFTVNVLHAPERLVIDLYVPE